MYFFILAVRKVVPTGINRITMKAAVLGWLYFFLVLQMLFKIYKSWKQAIKLKSYLVQPQYDTAILFSLPSFI